MRASKLIAALEAAKAKHGDLEVCALIDDYAMGVIDELTYTQFPMVGPQDDYVKRPVFFLE